VSETRQAKWAAPGGQAGTSSRIENYLGFLPLRPLGPGPHGSIKRVASGVGEGAIAVSFVHQYLAHL